MKSTGNYSDEIKRLKKAIVEVDAVVIGAGAGLSTSAGFVYNGDRFEKHFSDFGKKYGLFQCSEPCCDETFENEQMTWNNPKATYACINYGEAACPGEIEAQSICINGDIGETLSRLSGVCEKETA